MHLVECHITEICLISTPLIATGLVQRTHSAAGNGRFILFLQFVLIIARVGVCVSPFYLLHRVQVRRAARYCVCVFDSCFIFFICWSGNCCTAKRSHFICLLPRMAFAFPSNDSSLPVFHQHSVSVCWCLCLPSESLLFQLVLPIWQVRVCFLLSLSPSL